MKYKVSQATAPLKVVGRGPGYDGPKKWDGDQRNARACQVRQQRSIFMTRCRSIVKIRMHTG